jgi:transglutaminase-like putative cysteine protease
MTTGAGEVTFIFRASALVVGCCGVVALAVTGMLPVVLAVGAVALLCAAAAAPVHVASPDGRAARRVVASIVIVTAGVFALLSGPDPAAIVDMTAAMSELGHVIAPLMTGVLVGQFLVADRPRDVLVALVLGGMTFLLVLGMAARPAVALPLLVAWPAVIVGCHEAYYARVRAATDVVARADGEARAPFPLRHLAMVTLSAAVVAVVVAMVVPPPEGIANRNGFAGGSTGAPGSAGGRSAEAYSSGVLDLRARGSLPDTPVAEIPADSPVLWRGAVLADYDGIRWRAAAGDAWAAPGPGAAPGSVRHDAVRLRQGFSGVLLAPGRPLDVNVAGRLLRGAGSYLIAAPGGATYPSSYVVTSDVQDPPADVLRGASGPDQGVGSTALPAQLPSRVTALARQVTSGAATRYDAVRSVELFLADRATYRLDSPVPPPGRDAVDHFLFDARTGFCEQFASAETVLLRAVGIPARLVTGFAGGSRTDGGRLLRSADAHAWVEVWYPGVGWVASDPTAGATRADGSGALLTRLDALLRSLQDRAGLFAASGALLALLGLAWWAARRRTRSSAASTAARSPSPVVAAFLRLEAALERAGTPRAPAESLSELATRLPAERPVADAMAVLEQVCYAGRPPDAHAVQEAARTIDDVAAGLLAAQSR